MPSFLSVVARNEKSKVMEGQSPNDSLDDKISEGSSTVEIKSKRRKIIIWTVIITTLLAEIGLTLFFVLRPEDQGENI